MNSKRSEVKPEEIPSKSLRPLLFNKGNQK